MINVKELRIGNYVLYKENKAQVSQIGLSHIFAYTYYKESKNPMSLENKSLDICDCSPILLNEDILLSIGFKLNKHLNCWETEGLIIKNTSNGFKVFIECEDSWYSQSVFGEFKFLHQLQNIYFDLTGKELGITL